MLTGNCAGAGPASLGRRGHSSGSRRGLFDMCQTIFRYVSMILIVSHVALGTARGGPILESAKAKAAEQVANQSGFRASATTKVLGLAGVGSGSYLAYVYFRDRDLCKKLQENMRATGHCEEDAFNGLWLGAYGLILAGLLGIWWDKQHGVVVNVGPSQIGAGKTLSF